jgi:NADH-quinone oxidoreductase subunit F
MLDILTDICTGNGHSGDIDLLVRICVTMLESSLCALGRSAPNPVLSTIRYFREEYEAHIKDKRCQAGVCPNLTRFVIKPEKCMCCGVCEKVCKVHSIHGQAKKNRTICTDKCISCGSCRLVCRFDAIVPEGGA